MKKSIYMICTLALAGMVVACGGQKKSSDQTADTTEAANPNLIAEGQYEKLIPASDAGPAYVLVDKPQVDLAEFKTDADGYITIFDGTFKGWRGYLKDNVPPRWVIDGDAIKMNGSGGGEAQVADGGDLIFSHKFKNFELSFEWKVAKGSNSGILYLAQEVKGQPIYISSPEYQILDNANHPDAKLGKDGNRQSSSLYDMIPAVPQNSKPFGEWNTGTIMVYKGTVVHSQNGENMLEYHLWTPQWTEMLQASKFSKTKWPLAFELLNNLGGDAHEGYIGLQDHGDDVWYRNIRVKIME
ncbi:MAG: DUF1080 domain-containing protein [Prevotellaceae bacterium]|jgi:hypothetical protein|nr:DUF1080 domain-containing protein [Prevotellaceae bacterium]